MKRLFTLITIIISTSAFSSGQFSFEDIQLAGKGCKAESTELVKSPDSKTVSILFSNFSVEVPQYDGDNDNDAVDGRSAREGRFNERVSRKRCRVIVRALIPEGERAEGLNVSIDFRGFTQVDSGTIAKFRSTLISFDGMRRRQLSKIPIVSREWREAGTNEDWTITANKTIAKQTPCARRGDREVKFVINSQIAARILKQVPTDSTSAYVNVDSSDFSGQLKVKVNTSKCSSGGSTRPNRPPRYNDRKCKRGYIWKNNRCVRIRRERNRR